ncbi:condensation domain-containing protein, partial [Bacillus cereus]|uniref:condensation domain-containing protein n=1 Tax=Bacillus cereus TaxID=1396 RepID=UPI00192A2254
MNIIKKGFPLSQPQMRIWYTEKMYPHISIGNITGIMRLKERLDLELLKESIQLLFKNCETLRIRITEEDGYPSQYVEDYCYKEVLHYHFQNEFELDNWAQKQAEVPFIILNKDLIEISVFTLGNNETGFLVKMHHLISDAWTMTLIGDMLIKYYSCLLYNEPVQNESEHSYKEYVEQEIKYIESEKINKSKEFWKNKFISLPETTKFNFKSGAENLSSKRISFSLNDKLVKGIADYCKKEGISVNTYFLSILNIYLSHVTREDDLTILTSVHNRNSPKDRRTLGMYISTVPFRTQLSPELSFTSFAKKIASEQFAVYRHQKYPYNFLAQNIRELHKTSIHELCQVLFSYQNAKFVNQQYDFQTKWYFNGYQETPIIIHINDRENNGQMIIDFDYRIDSFDESNIEDIYKKICILIELSLKNPDVQLNKFEMLTQVERKQIVCEFNQTAAPFSKEKTLSQIFEEQVEKHPERIAVTCEDQSLSYTELNERANQ